MNTEERISQEQAKAEDKLRERLRLKADSCPVLQNLFVPDCKLQSKATNRINSDNFQNSPEQFPNLRYSSKIYFNGN